MSNGQVHAPPPPPLQAILLQHPSSYISYLDVQAFQPIAPPKKDLYITESNNYEENMEVF